MRKRIFNLTSLKLIFLFLLLAIGAGMTYILAQRSERVELTFTGDAPKPNTLFEHFVYLTGQVNNPGVYEIGLHTRIDELIAQAGGFTSQADSEYINKQLDMARIVSDEEHIHIPTSAELNTKSTSNRININTASSAQLDTLPGIGPATAAKIIAARPYKSVDELVNISGVGATKLASIRDLIEI